jgi:hypothetical protein
VSILQPGVSRSDIGVTAIKPYGVTGENLDIRGRQSVAFTVGKREYRHEFLVCPLPTQADGLLETDFLDEAGAVMDLDSMNVSLASEARQEGGAYG